MVIGWHFFQEGADKLRSGKFSSVGFLSNAKGPLRPYYEGMIWDADGHYRLDKDQTLDAWHAYKDRAIDYYGFDEKQAKSADRLYARYAKQLEWFLASNAEDIDEYFLGLERRDKNRGVAAEQTDDELAKARAMADVPSLRGQRTTIEGDLKKKRDGWLRTIDKMWNDFELDVAAIGDSDQQAKGKLALQRVGRRTVDSVTVDRIIPWFDTIIGGLLIVGLFTRLASLAGAAFLASVVLSQWPLAPDAGASIYQAIELFALLALAGTGAGRFAGLDFFIHAALGKSPAQES